MLKPKSTPCSGTLEELVGVLDSTPFSCHNIEVKQSTLTLGQKSMTIETRICSKCGAEHPLTEEFFAKNQSTNTGGDKYFRPECKSCTRKASQGKQAAYKLAGKPKRPPLGTPCQRCGRTDKKLVFDHCHETLAHRGWLCDNCNRSMGMLGDDISGMISSAVYIAKTTGKDRDDILSALNSAWNK